MAAFGWSADRAWHTTIHDIVAALDAHREINDPEYAKAKSFKKFKAAVLEAEHGDRS